MKQFGLGRYWVLELLGMGNLMSILLLLLLLCTVERVHTVFVLEVVPRQRRVPPFFSINLENPISVLYSTKFHPQRNTFLPFPRPLWGTLAHPERTGAALDSSKANAPPWYFSAARLRGPSGETTAHRDLLRGCWPKSVQQTTWNCENHASRVRVRSVSVQ